MKLDFIYIALVFIIVGCSGNYNRENIEYGDEIFFAEFEALLSHDRLSLYANDVFQIQISNNCANGKYNIKADTIILEYFIPTNLFPDAYLLNGDDGWIEPLSLINRNMKIETRADSGLKISKNEINQTNFKITYSNFYLFSKAFNIPREPVIYVINNKITYVIEDNENSYGRTPLGADTIWSGVFRKSSIDSIITLTYDSNDSNNKTTENEDYRLQSIHRLDVSNNFINYTISDYNRLDASSAKNIISILNANLPDSIRGYNYEKCQLF